MLRLLSDENFNNDIVTGLLRKQPDLDVVRVQDVGLLEALDPVILAWAAPENRIILTHDRETFPVHAYFRVEHGEQMPGVFVVSDDMPIGRAIEEILILSLCSLEDEWEGRVQFLPLR